MKSKNSLFEQRRKKVSKDAKEFISLSFDIVDRIHEILESQGKSQADLANLLEKSPSEISKWMRGNHNFTLETIAKINTVLSEKLFVVPTKENKSLNANINEFAFSIKCTPEVPFQADKVSYNIEDFNIKELNQAFDFNFVLNQEKHYC